MPFPWAPRRMRSAMARGFSSAPGASADVVEASAHERETAKMLVLGMIKNGLVRAAIAERRDCLFGLKGTLAHDYSADGWQGSADAFPPPL